MIFFSLLNGCLIYQDMERKSRLKSLYKDKLMQGWKKATENPEGYQIDRVELVELWRAFVRERQIVKGEHMLF